MIHELGHAIGLNHEQTRPDREHYVWVRQEYMSEANKYNSNLKTWEAVNDYGVPYDYSSIMQYGENVSFTHIQYSLRVVVYSPTFRNDSRF